jgi:hypothetical protein
MSSALVADFDLTIHGFPFGNCFPGRPALVVDVPLYGRVVLARASGGLCGGMSFSAIDYYSFGMPAPQASDVSDTLFEHLRIRQLSSIHIPTGILRYYQWQSRRNDSLLVRDRRLRGGISWLTLEREWPRLRQALDAGRLAPLGLIMAGSFNPVELVRNHQVLAYGYTLAGSDLTLKVYDPNWPGDRDLTLTTTTDRPDLFRWVEHSVEGTRAIRGFFLTRYTRPRHPPPEV